MTAVEAPFCPSDQDARLIAAAPELLAALKSCEELLTSCGINGASQPIMSARAAIAKATD